MRYDGLATAEALQFPTVQALGRLHVAKAALRLYGVEGAHRQSLSVLFGSSDSPVSINLFSEKRTGEDPNAYGIISCTDEEGERLDISLVPDTDPTPDACEKVEIVRDELYRAVKKVELRDQRAWLREIIYALGTSKRSPKEAVEIVGGLLEVAPYHDAIVEYKTYYLDQAFGCSGSLYARWREGNEAFQSFGSTTSFCDIWRIELRQPPRQDAKAFCYTEFADGAYTLNSRLLSARAEASDQVGISNLWQSNNPMDLLDAIQAAVSSRSTQQVEGMIEETADLTAALWEAEYYIRHGL